MSEESTNAADVRVGEPVVRIEGLRKSFGDNVVLRGIDLEVQRGEVVVILGPSGSGKSTLLRCVNLLETPTDGRIFFEGRVLLPMARAMLAAVKIGRPAMASASAPSAGVRFPRASCRQAVPDEWFSARPLIRVPALLA